MAFLFLYLHVLHQLIFPKIPLIGYQPQPQLRKNKVVFVIGATGTGKSKLAIDLAVQLGAAEIINSDKMQFYDGLDVLTNKVTVEESAGVVHHFIGGVHPDADFTAADFCRKAMLVIESVVANGRVPIVAGGSNSYIEELVDGNGGELREKYECCFLWVDVGLPVLYSYVSGRVDTMVERGMVDEVRRFFNPEGDYSRGVRRAIGVAEMDRYFRAEAALDAEARAAVLSSAIEEVKANTCELVRRQLRKIQRLRGLPGWDVRRIDATAVFAKRGRDADEAWVAQVAAPSVRSVREFLAVENTTYLTTVPSTVGCVGGAHGERRPTV